MDPPKISPIHCAGLRISQQESNKVWLTIITSQHWRPRFELKAQSLETPLGARCLAFFFGRQPLFFSLIYEDSGLFCIITKDMGDPCSSLNQRHSDSSVQQGVLYPFC